jgi:hypothetical protein
MGNRKRINAIRLQPVIANDKQMIANIHVLVKLLNIAVKRLSLLEVQ